MLETKILNKLKKKTFHRCWKKKNNLPKKTISVYEGALFNTLFFPPAKCKMHADF